LRRRRRRRPHPERRDPWFQSEGRSIPWGLADVFQVPVPLKLLSYLNHKSSRNPRKKGCRTLPVEIDEREVYVTTATRQRENGDLRCSRAPSLGCSFVKDN
jgi:hypothetical protein